MSKKVLVINGHPNPESFNKAICEAYIEGAKKSGAELKEINIGELDFNSNLSYGFSKKLVWEPDLEKAWEKIEWSDHIVWIHPVWWGGLPAVTKGFIDRIFLPGKAFKYRPNSVWWDKLLKGKTAHIITTLDQPSYFYRWFYGRPSVNQLKKTTLEFCGVKPVKVTYVGIIKTADETKRKKWLDEIRKKGERLI